MIEIDRYGGVVIYKRRPIFQEHSAPLFIPESSPTTEEARESMRDKGRLVPGLFRMRLGEEGKE